jgi:hypothetical protein
MMLDALGMHVIVVQMHACMGASSIQKKRKRDEDER